jgi:predicted DNA binding protein
VTDVPGSDRYVAALETLRSVNAAVVDASSRTELEQRVPGRLVDGPYDGAWLLTPPVADETATVRTSAGRNLPKDVRAATGVPDPAGTVVQRSDRTFVAVPCSNDGTTDAVLVVSAPTVDDAERDLLVEVGETIGHGLASIRRKTALMNDNEVELELRIGNATDPIFDREATDATFEFVRTIPIGDDAFLQYVAVEGMDSETFEREMETFEGVDWVRRVGDEDDPMLYETRYRDPSIVGTIAAAGGRVVSAAIEDDDMSIVARVPGENAVEQLLASVSDRFPEAHVRARRSLVDGPTSVELGTTAFDRLTDRQRTVLETAYVAGYFDRPRRSTGEDLAASLDVSPSTFYQHLRAGQRKVFEVLFDG